MKPGFPIGFATICVLFMALSPATVRAQSDEPTVEREIKFIRGLAKDWGFIDLAQTELEKLQRSTQSDASLQKRLGQVDAALVANDHLFGADIFHVITVCVGCFRLPRLQQAYRCAALRAVRTACYQDLPGPR